MKLAEANEEEQQEYISIMLNEQGPKDLSGAEMSETCVNDGFRPMLKKTNNIFDL